MPAALQGMDGLVKMLVGKLQPLQINGTTISGTVYTGLISRYVEAINAGGAQHRPLLRHQGRSLLV
jgi:hypothetical protein